jgi:hypothetical protein
MPLDATRFQYTLLHKIAQVLLQKNFALADLPTWSMFVEE